MCQHCEALEDDEDDQRPNLKTRHRGRNWQGPFRKTPDRLLGMGFIRLYQLTLSGFIGNSCRHIPTCSEFGYEAVARHGLWFGFWMTARRFSSCGPFGSSGLDPVPETLAAHQRWWMPWRYRNAVRKAA
ncbi:putative membrane protein insertion efficiency factor [Neorhizobium galegae]|uniref:membrane protein insertion efficiency factor YidD n=1 Tax=Neorhizobium galegae TaxID=399 RepID=UPI001AEA176F|nr:membrane protein insertion efficiency factor YidD [Neorhizobium galegae]MBP2549510.1 putative membrane protein insertion efficiency factor [Neorhizobium galegae]